ncbi:MAG: SDR family NAD(P)-dependent oxidoreductase [Eubacteriales bacterium]|nr:SDR family NAD(P)-dependent oxidoreductase [Eubacteriales bacterium]
MGEKRIAVVTGGTRGMGRAISLELAKRGNIVCAVYRSHVESAASALKEMQALEPECGIYRADVSKEGEAARVIEVIGRKFGRIDILVNNAGIFDFRFIDEMDGDYLDRVLNTNFKSQFYMLKFASEYMKKNHYGRVANASSISGHFADCGLTAYAASKAGVDMLTKIAAGELGPYHITVNAYAPGIIHTDMTDAMIRERGDEQVKDLTLNRFGTGEDVAALVGFLTSPEGGYITGEIIGVDGGMFKVQNAYLAYQRAKEQSAHEK